MFFWQQRKNDIRAYSLLHVSILIKAQEPKEEIKVLDHQIMIIREYITEHKPPREQDLC